MANGDTVAKKGVTLTAAHNWCIYTQQCNTARIVWKMGIVRVSASITNFIL